MKKKEAQAVKNGVVIGASKDAIAEARAAINDILKSSCDQSTKVVALETLRTVCQVNNTSISNCNIEIA